MNVWDATGTSNSDPALTWSYASDAVLEERVYYLHDWHQDLVQLIGDDGAAVERVHYSAYGVPFGLHPADLDLDGDVDGSDFSKFSTLYSNGTYDLLADFDHDGDEDSSDYYAFVTLYGVKEDLGRGNLARSTIDNRVGYAGYQWDRFVSKYHVRNRVYEPTTGRWLNRDPIDYTPGLMNLYEYVGSRPVRSVDPRGLHPYDGLSPGDHWVRGKGIRPRGYRPERRYERRYRLPDDQPIIVWKGEVPGKSVETLYDIAADLDANPCEWCYISTHGPNGVIGAYPSVSYTSLRRVKQCRQDPTSLPTDIRRKTQDLDKLLWRIRRGVSRGVVIEQCECAAGAEGQELFDLLNELYPGIEWSGPTWRVWVVPIIGIDVPLPPKGWWEDIKDWVRRNPPRPHPSPGK